MCLRQCVWGFVLLNCLSHDMQHADMICCAVCGLPGWQRMCILVLCLKPANLLDPSAAFASFSGCLTTSPVVERLVFAKACVTFGVAPSASLSDCRTVHLLITPPHDVPSAGESPFLKCMHHCFSLCFCLTVLTAYRRPRVVEHLVSERHASLSAFLFAHLSTH